MSPDLEYQRAAAGGPADPFAHMVAHLSGQFVMPELHAPGRVVLPLELRRQVLGIPTEDAPE